MTSDLSRPTGSQAVSRALTLLKLVGMNHDSGIVLRTIVDVSGLDRTTAYRLLSCLVESGMLERDQKKRYRLGLEAMQLGLRSMSRVPILERCRPLMIRLARRTEDTVYIVVRNGDYAHCIHYEEGSFPIKALVLQIDGLRLLGVGSAGTALLSTLSDAEIRDFHRRQHKELPAQRAKLPSLLDELRTIRKRGYATTENLVAEGVSGVGVPFEITPGSYAAISIGAIRSRMAPERSHWIAKVMREEISATGWTLHPAHTE
ncbi:IclR family transcriptional regulator [Bordetella sp. 15P40C-2]|uniref:IclR family transcriptional regulator n=1 Tax=Bordetella sp. 15P40C-2 TaxID=2572246 RepID=UPI00351B122A